MNKYFQYFGYLFKHKYYVAKECFKHGLYFRGIIHDWSKFLPSEWFPYMNYFYGNYDSKDDRRFRSAKLLSIDYKECTKEYWKERFDLAWLHHQHLNKHHWQHWILHQDDGSVKILEMGYDDTVEMFCDWVGAGLAVHGKRDIVEWYDKNKSNIILHEKTRYIVEELIIEEKIYQ